MTGTQALPELVRIVPRVAIVMFSNDARLKTEQVALDAGADAYFEKTHPITHVLDAVVDLTS